MYSIYLFIFFEDHHNFERKLKFLTSIEISFFWDKKTWCTKKCPPPYFSFIRPPFCKTITDLTASHSRFSKQTKEVLQCMLHSVKRRHNSGTSLLWVSVISGIICGLNFDLWHISMAACPTKQEQCFVPTGIY